MALGLEIATELIAAVKAGDVEQTHQLISADANNNSAPEWGLCRLLGIAAAHGNLDLVNALLAMGAELNPTDRHIVEPLWYATANGHVDIVKRLLRAGARTKGCSGRNMFLPAVVSGNAELVSMFLDYGANPNEEFRGWLTPLELAMRLGHQETANLLRNAGADQTAILEKVEKEAMQA